MFIKERLLTPGPTATAEFTRSTLGSAHPHHRSPAYKVVHERMLERLRWLWDTDDDVLFVSGSGTAGMESAMRTSLREGDRVLVVTGGKFAERWLTIARKITDQVDTLDVDWGRSARPEDVIARLQNAESPYDAVICVASETSTGARQPVEAIGEFLRTSDAETLFLVDGITAVGSFDLSMRRHRIDVLVSGTQKAFGLPPGGAMVGMSARAWRVAERDGCDDYYLDLRRERKQTKTGQTAYTPAVGLVYALDELLEFWQRAGRERLFQHTDAIAHVFREGIRGLGLDLYPQDEASSALTAVKVPEGIAASQISRWMRDHIGMTLSAGQAEIKDRIVRVGHIGAVDGFDMLMAVSGIEAALQVAGASIETGRGVAAAQAVLNSYLKDNEFLAYSP